MGSLRNPIGPLPSSIYWRRRAVALVIVALLVLLAVWALGLGGGDSGNEGKGDDGKPPVSTITPGPTDSGPAITERPGGRDESNEGAGSQGGSGGDDGDGGSGGVGDGSSGGGSGWRPGGSDSSATGGDSAGGGGSGSGAGGGSGDSGGGAAVPAGSKLPACGSGVTVTLRSVHKEYEPGEKPEFELTVRNKRGTPCKLDLGRKESIVTIKSAGGKKIWASDDCVRDEKPALYQLSGSGTSTHTFVWYREPSVANCGTPASDSVKPGDYEIEVDVKGVRELDASFELK
ncbi:hypothetical protein G4Z16_13320 [Streptomyces bathyalis]|uniref:Uncharacterized protein n=1 Tax=Streptomyces bathyalis TaxID=2710756 RepID=A0A7T1T6B7_9ACTN|nr:hypothetical protein [Streptomyces bathyalis]QPP07201.1 hypothetical protein G4Z16_13320 [Streptomyces bathyalis]